ncbi:4979_t:CDS:2, partial [Acaulospora colombiana]
WDVSRSAVHESAKKMIRNTLGGKGDGPVASEIQPVEVKAKLDLTSRQGENLTARALDAHASRPSQSHSALAVSEIARNSPTTTHRISLDKKGSYEALLLAYCHEQGLKRPVFNHKEASPGQFTMSVIVGKEKFSLNTLFSNLHAGREGICRK